MSISQRFARCKSAEWVVWGLIGSQIAITGWSMCSEAYNRWQFRREWVQSQRESKPSVRRPPPLPNTELKVGLRIPGIEVRNADGRFINLLRQGKERQAILFVSDCAPCVYRLLRRYDRLWQEGACVRVIARSPSEKIQQARQEYGWKLPIYSDYELPQVALACRVVYRPAILVLDQNGRVMYTQGATDDAETAVSEVERNLRPSHDGPRKRAER